MRHKIIFSLFTLVCTNLQAQENNKRPIEFNDLYSGEFRSKVISSVNWYDTNSYVTRKEGAQGYGIYEVVFDTSGDEISSSDIFLGSNSFDNAKVSYKVYGEFVAYKKNYRKKWRYSGLYDYQITQIGSSQVLASINDVQYLTFNGAELSTGKAYFLFVQNNDLFVLNLKISEAGDKIEAATLPVTNHGEKEKIFNGIPDWVYEEEVIGTDHLAYFAPGKAGQQWIVYVRSDDTKVEHIQYQTYGQSENNREIDIYPKMEDIAYPKPDTENPLLKVYAVNLDRLFGLELDENGERWSMQMSQFLCNGNSNYPPYSDTVLKGIHFYESDDRPSFIVTWFDRIQTKSYPLRLRLWGFDDFDWEFTYNLTLPAIQVMQGRENSCYPDLDSRFGVQEICPGWLLRDMTHYSIPQDDRFYYMIQSVNGYHQLAFIIDNLPIDHPQKEPLLLGPLILTESKVNILQIYGVRPIENDIDNVSIIFRAAAPLAKDRNIFSITVPYELFDYANTTIPDWQEFDKIPYEYWVCLSCETDLVLPGRSTSQPVSQCLYASINYHELWYSDLVIYTCSGPDAPFSLVRQFNGDNTGFRDNSMILSDNVDYLNAISTLQLPDVQFGKFPSRTGFNFQYEIWTPYNFDPNSSQQHPLLVEIYSGPTSQAVTSSFKFGLSDKFGTSNCETCMNAIHVKIDTRGSGNAGDELMYAVYKKLGWFEKIDITEFVRALVLNETPNNWVNPVANKINPDQTGIWGWSYGGFATTHTISLGDDVWKCGVSVAALNSRYYYDSIYTEMALDLYKNNENGYLNGTITNMELENFKKAKYTMIHGTADDNVHFHNAAMISKALIEAGVEFNNYFYADEAHSINYDPMAKQHVNRLIFRKMQDCYNGHL